MNHEERVAQVDRMQEQLMPVIKLIRDRVGTDREAGMALVVHLIIFYQINPEEIAMPVQMAALASIMCDTPEQADEFFRYIVDNTNG